MNRRIVVMILLIFYSFTTVAIDDCFEFMSRCDPIEDEKTSQSFIFPRPVYHNLMAQLSTGWVDLIYEKDHCFLGSIEAVGIYQQSSSMDKLKRYFLINEREALVIKGDLAPQPTLRDVRAEWVGLPSNFVGTLQINPKQQQGSLWFEYNQDVKKFINNKFLDSLWVAISMPVQFVENDLGLTQTNVQNPGPNNFDIIAAFNQGLWHFGKLNPKKKHRAGVAEINVKLGATFMARDGFQIGYYSSIFVPLTGGQNPEFLFDPFLGNNRHFGFSAGVHFQLPLNDDTDCKLIAFFFDIENLYLIRSGQRRTLDLMDKPWSRFLLFNNINGDSNIPGVNVLTRKVTVRPFNMADLSTGLRFNLGAFDLEIAYNLWVHPSEKLVLEDREFPEIFGIAGTLPFTTASKSTISFQAPNDFVFIPITQFDLDLLSGCARSAVVHRPSIAAGAIIDRDCYTIIFGFGAFIEFPQQNTALNNAGVWGKIGASF